MVRATVSQTEQTWRITDNPLRERLEAWRDVVDSTHLEWAVRAAPVDTGKPFSASVRRRRYGSVDLLDCRCDPCAGGRGLRQTRATDVDTVGVLAVMSGREVLEQDGRQVELRAGDIALWDSRSPARFDVIEPLRKRTLLVPLPSVARRWPDADRGRQWSATLLPRRTPARELLLHHLQALASDQAAPDHTAGMSASAATDIVAAAMSTLVSGCPSPTPPATGPTRPAQRQVRLDDVYGTIEQRLSDVATGVRPLSPHELSPTTLAALHAMSVRTLHLLAADGERIGARVRRLRLEGARRHLEVGTFRSIAATASHWGFADAAHFTRSYSRWFGELPRDTIQRSRDDSRRLG